VIAGRNVAAVESVPTPLLVRRLRDHLRIAKRMLQSSF
jgi:hypothetical protein